MHYLFTAYGGYLLIAAVAFLFFASIESQLPAKRKGRKLTAAYPLFAQLLCAVLIVFCVFFALALSTANRESTLSRVWIFSLVGFPMFILSFESFGKKIELDDDFISRSYFGIISRRRSSSMVTRVAHNAVWKMFRIHFSDGSTLWISTMMRGSAELAQQLDEKKNGS